MRIIGSATRTRPFLLFATFCLVSSGLFRMGSIVMSRLIKVVILIVVIGFSLNMFGCSVIIGERPVYAPPPPEPGPPPEKGPPPWAPAHGYRAKHHYYYYPESYVYFDVGRGLYFYYYGRGWQVSFSLPAAIHIDAKNYVVLEMNTDKPFEFHSDVVKRYPPGQVKKLKDEGKSKGK